MRFLFLLFLLITTLGGYAQQALGIADSLLLDNQTEKALRVLDDALGKATIDSEKQLIQIKQAEVYSAQQAYTKAQDLLSLIARQNPQGHVLAHLKMTTGLLALYQGRNELAEENLLHADKLFQESNASNSLDIAKCLTTLGLVYFNSGKNSQAEEQLLMALNIRTKLLPEAHELLAASYNDLGLIYSQRDPDKALTYYEKALPIYKKLHGNVHAKIAINNTNTGVIYQNLELFGDAINNLEAALDTWEKLIQQPNPRKAFVLNQLGYTYQQMKNNTNAEIYYKRSLAEYQKTYGAKHPDLAGIYNLLGNLKKSSDVYDSALLYYHKALQSNLKNFDASDITSVPSAQEYYNGNYLLYSLMYKAQAYEAKHFGKTLKFSDLELALKNLMVCDTLIDKLRQQSTNEADKISLGSIANEVYADGVRIATHMSEVAFKNRSYYREQAFYFAEKSKSAVLLEAISDVNAKSFAGIPEEVLDQEQNLKASIALCAQKLSQKPAAEEETYLREALFSLNRQYQTFTEELEKKYPEYFNLKFNTSSPTISALQKSIDSKTSLISYFIDDSKLADNTRLYIFLIDKKKLTITSHSLPKTFDRYLTGFRNSIFYNDQKTLNTVGHTLYKLLIPKISSTTTNIVIFPTGRLGVIPFEALLTKRVKDGTRDKSYLLHKYALRYEFSASLALQKTTGEKTSQASILLCAPVTFSEKDNLVDLPGTEEEVNSIAALFQQSSTPQTILTHGAASEATIKSDKLKDYTLIHFATHGTVDESNPELSRIFLKSTNDAEDGYLYSGEIYNLQLNADLVTLSACQTGLGKISKGEGVIGLSRALVYAGAKNIIVSYWSVADQSTAELMTNFYRDVLTNRSTLAESLQKVKVDMLNSSSYSAPYYWAPFVLIGF